MIVLWYKYFNPMSFDIFCVHVSCFFNFSYKITVLCANDRIRFEKLLQNILFFLFFLLMVNLLIIKLHINRAN